MATFKKTQTFATVIGSCYSLCYPPNHGKSLCPLRETTEMTGVVDSLVLRPNTSCPLTF